MPIQTRTNPKTGETEYRWGNHGEWYTSRDKALAQQKAAYANGYKGEKTMSKALDKLRQAQETNIKNVNISEDSQQAKQFEDMLNKMEQENYPDQGYTWTVTSTGEDTYDVLWSYDDAPFKLKRTVYDDIDEEFFSITHRGEAMHTEYFSTSWKDLFKNLFYTAHYNF